MPLAYTGMGAASWYGRGKGGGVGWGGPLRLPWSGSDKGGYPFSSLSPRLWGCPRIFPSPLVHRRRRCGEGS